MPFESCVVGIRKIQSGFLKGVLVFCLPLYFISFLVIFDRSKLIGFILYFFKKSKGFELKEKKTVKEEKGEEQARMFKILEVRLVKSVEGDP